MALRLLLVLLICACVGAVTAQQQFDLATPVAAAAECPCLAAGSPAYDALVAEVAADATLPPMYGLDGCRAWDAGRAKLGCDKSAAAGAPTFCAHQWCFVDEARCAFDEARCLAAGGAVGSDVHFSCRERRARDSPRVPSRAAYSYETCGYTNTFDASRLERIVAGTSIRVFIGENPPWAFSRPAGDVDERFPQFGAKTGILTRFFQDMLGNYSPAVNVTLLAGLASPQAMALYPFSSFSACVHDVSVGLADLCINSYWMTPERMLLTPFTSPIDNEFFYLYVPQQLESETFASIIERPFLPFSGRLWLLALVFLVCSGMIMVVTDSGGNYDDFPRRGFASRAAKGIYFAFLGTFGAAPANKSRTIPSKIAQLSLGLFILILVSSYTANLATLLVLNNQSNAINGIQDAIDAGLTICVPNDVASVIQSKHPTLNAHNYGFVQPAQLIRDGTCAGAVMNELNALNTFAGRANAVACAAVDSGAKLAAEAFCEIDADTGRPSVTRDCDIVRVGELVATIAIAMPVSGRLAHSLSWSTLTTVLAGRLSALKDEFRTSFPRSMCGAAAPLDSKRLPAKSMYGTFFVSGIGMAVALLLAIAGAVLPAENPTVRRWRWLLGAGDDDDVDDDGDESEGDGEHGNNKTERRGLTEAEADQRGKTRGELQRKKIRATRQQNGGEATAASLRAVQRQLRELREIVLSKQAQSAPV
jgi:hypothetical protein